MIREFDTTACVLRAHETISLHEHPDAFACGIIYESCRQLTGSLTSYAENNSFLDREHRLFLLSGIRILADRICSCPALSSSLEELLRAYYLIENTPGLMNGDHLLPVAYPEFASRDFACGCKSSLSIIKRAAIDNEIKQAIGGVIENVINTNSNLSRQHFNFLLIFNAAIIKLDELAGPAAEQRVANLLVGLDFNHIQFITWYHEQLFSEINRHRGAERMMAIINLLEEVRAIPVKISYSFYPRFPPVRNYIRGLLEEEFRQAVMKDLVAHQAIASAKLSVSLSVAEIACLLKLLQAEGVFRPDNIREILRMGVAGLRSKRQGNFSFRNLSKEYYGVNQQTAAMIRSLLQRMLTNLNRSFFPVVFASALMLRELLAA